MVDKKNKYIRNKKKRFNVADKHIASGFIMFIGHLFTSAH